MKPRAVVLLTACMLTARAAHAEEAPRAEVFLGRTVGHRIDGCSLSRNTLTVSSAYGLTLAPDGTARLHVEHAVDNHTMHMGQIGDGPISSAVTLDHQRDVFNLEGTVQRASGTFDVHFVRSTEQQARWTGYGTLPLGAPSTRDVDLHLRCEQKEAEVETTDHANRTTERFFECQFTPALLQVLVDGDDEFPLSTRDLLRETYVHFPGHEEGTTYAWAASRVP